MLQLTTGVYHGTFGQWQGLAAVAIAVQFNQYCGGLRETSWSGTNLEQSHVGPVPSREKHRSMSAISTPLGSLDGMGATGTLPLLVRETVYSAHTEERKLIGLRCFKQRSCLGVNEPVG